MAVTNVQIIGAIEKTRGESRPVGIALVPVFFAWAEIVPRSLTFVRDDRGEMRDDGEEVWDDRKS